MPCPRVGAFICLGDIACRTIIETAETNNIDGAMLGIHLPELARRDTLLSSVLTRAQREGMRYEESEVARTTSVTAFQGWFLSCVTKFWSSSKRAMAFWAYSP
jgi:hypothetical protein